MFSAEGKFRYSNEVKFNSQSAFLLARSTVQNAFIQYEDAQIKPDASKLIEQGKAAPFQQRFGDGFVRGMQTGGEIHAVIAITSIDREEQDINPEFTSGVGTLEFFTVHVATGIHNSRLTRIK